MPPTLIITPFIYSEFYGDSPTREMLIDLVRQMHWQDIVGRLTAIASISWLEGVEDAKQQQALFREFSRHLLYGSVVESKLRVNSHQRFYVRESLLALLRIAAVEKAEPAKVLSEDQFANIFHKAILAANELVVNELNPAQLTGGPADLLATELRSRISQEDNIHDMLARTYALFEWHDAGGLRGRSTNLSLREDFQQFTGLNPDEYLATTYLMLSRAANLRRWQDFATLGITFDADQWLSSLGIVQKALPKAWLEKYSIALTDAREDWRKEPSLSFAGAGPLWRAPFVQDDEGHYFMPTPFFVANMLGDGTYFQLFDGYGSRKNDFATLFGHFFQDYVEARFRGGYEGRDDVEIWPIVPTNRGKVVDIVIREADKIMFVEIVAKRMRLVDSVLRLDRDSIEGDLQKGIVDKLYQLQEGIDSFRRGELLPEIERLPNQQLIPLLVAPNEWPRMYVLFELLKAPPYDSFFEGCEPVEFIDAAEVEDLEGRLRLGLRLAALFDRKNSTTQGNRALSLHNYLTVAEPNTFPAESPTRQKGANIAQTLMKLVSGWSS